MARLGAKEVSAAAICAALYAVCSYATSYIPTPWIVQLRPAVVIPAVFAVLYGPLVGGLGAAVGTFIASILTYGTAVLTIFSGTPANFICFYLLGKLSKPFSIKNFVAAAAIGFLTGSVIIAFGLWLLLTKFFFLIPTATYALRGRTRLARSYSQRPRIVGSSHDGLDLWNGTNMYIIDRNTRPKSMRRHRARSLPQSLKAA
jgi:uncharacterized membrane protein